MVWAIYKRLAVFLRHFCSQAREYYNIKLTAKYTVHFKSIQKIWLQQYRHNNSNFVYPF